MIDYLDKLARVAADTRLDDLPPTTIAAAKRVLLDTLGAIVAGSAQPENQQLARLAAERSPGGTATLLGHREGADAFWAALVNATAGVALEVDEGNRLGGGHPAIHTLPAALAVAEEQGRDGRRLIEALVVGYEVGSRIGSATTVRPAVHSHGTWGTISSAVAVARLTDAPTATIRSVINLAASMSPANSWMPALRGATIRNLYPGRSAWAGMLAVDLQRCGFTGLTDAPHDVYGTILAERFDPALAEAGLEALGRGQRHRIEQNYFKLHACCRYNHFALDAVMGLRRAHGLAAADITGVEVTTIPFAAHMAQAEPSTMLEAKFSVPYAVAAALVLGRTDVSAFEPAAIADRRIRDLAQRVRINTDDAMSPRRNDQPTARVRITLRDGRTLDAVTSSVRGDAEDPISDGELEAKFFSLTSPIVGEPRARQVVEIVRDAERLKDVRELTRLCVPA